MKQELIVQLHADFEAICHQDEEVGTEFWLARELQPLLGYSHWRNFEPVIEKAITACENSGQPVEDHFARLRNMVEVADHFLDITKMVAFGSGVQRETEEVMLSRYACYLFAQNEG